MLTRLLVLLNWLAWSTVSFSQSLNPVSGPRQLNFSFDVSWEILRSGFNSNLDVALEADTYGESWSLQLINPYEIYLTTPRGRARVVGLKTQPSAEEISIDTLVVEERDFAELLGIQVEALDATVPKQIFIELPVVYSDPQTFILKANPKYFVSVTLNIQL